MALVFVRMTVVVRVAVASFCNISRARSVTVRAVIVPLVATANSFVVIIMTSTAGSTAMYPPTFPLQQVSTAEHARAIGHDDEETAHVYDDGLPDM